jgi:hypothetical protein
MGCMLYVDLASHLRRWNPLTFELRLDLKQQLWLQSCRPKVFLIVTSLYTRAPKKYNIDIECEAKMGFAGIRIRGLSQSFTLNVKGATRRENLQN